MAHNLERIGERVISMTTGKLEELGLIRAGRNNILSSRTAVLTVQRG